MIVGTCSKLDGLPILKVVSAMVVTKPTRQYFLLLNLKPLFLLQSDYNRRRQWMIEIFSPYLLKQLLIVLAIF